MTSQKTVNKSELAALLGVVPGSIARLTANGMPGPVVAGGGRGKPARYDAAACLAWQREQLVTTAGSNGTAGSPRDEYLKVLTEKARLDLATRRGEVVDVGEAKRDFAHCATILKTRLRAIPSAVAVRLVALAEQGPHAVHALLLREIDDVLRDLAQTPGVEWRTSHDAIG